MTVQCNETAAWRVLERHYQEEMAQFDVAADFAADPDRLKSLSQQAPYVFADLSKNRITAKTEQLLIALARECGLIERRDQMFAGAPVNSSEGRAAMHWLLRMPSDGGLLREQSLVTAMTAAVREDLRAVHSTLDDMLALAEQLRLRPEITDVVNIGIGGSHLGPEVVVNALEDWCDSGKRFHFVSNVDGHELGHVLSRVRPQSTLFIVASKSFTTAETMLNAHSARAWFLERSQDDACSLSEHFVALTSNVQAAAQFGIRRCLGFWDWVGGRYSLWSAIGLPIAIAVGAKNFRALLAGAHAMDAHFVTAPLARNLPVRLGLLDIWYRNFLGFGSRCIAPYSHGLRRLTAYLQQLEMESNGKQVDSLGRPLAVATSPVVWGEPGTNGQHAFFQMLHQGPDVIPVEFIALRGGGKYLGAHHHSLLINAIAQAQALMVGRKNECSEKYCPGNRPSSFLLLQQLHPTSLGALIALYEHRVFVTGAIWGINSFDQWGVELGKKLAKDLDARLVSGDWQGVDASTAGLIERLVAADLR